MFWSTVPYRELRTTVCHLGKAVPAVTLLWSMQTLAASVPPLLFSELDNLTPVEVAERLEQTSDPGNRLRLLLIKADQRQETPQQAQETLSQAVAMLATDTQGSNLKIEHAYADALHCDLAYYTKQPYRVPESCNRLPAHLPGLDDLTVRAIVLRTLGLQRYRDGQLAESLDLYRLALDAGRAANVPSVIARILTHRGISLRDYGLPEQALESFDRARIEVAGDRSILTHRIDTLIGSTQLSVDQAESALETFLRGLNWAEQNGASQLAVRLRDLTAQAYIELGDPDTAIQYLEGVFAGPVPNLAYIYRVKAQTTLATAYQARGDTEKANATFTAALRSANDAQDGARRRTVTLAYAEALTEQQKPEQSLVLVEPLIQELRQAEVTLHLVEALDVQSRAHAQLQQFALAYTAQTSSRELQRKLQSTNFERSLSFLRAELETDRQADELDLLRARETSLEAQTKLSRTLSLAFTLMGICGALLIYLLMSRRLQRQTAAASEQNSKELESLVIARTQALESELANRLILEEERRQLEVNMAEGDKLRTIGQLTSGVAHDFNNLMTVVTLSAELLTHGKQPLTPTQQQCVNDILLASESGSNVTSGLLAYARQQSLEPESIALHDYLHQSEPLLRRTLGEGIDLQTDLQQATLTIDRSNLTTALINLMANAREATGGRGTVQLKTELLANHRGPGRSGISPADWIKISVTDNGRGMNDTQRKRAVEPFYTTKSGAKGSGLGLSMVYGFAKQSGGDIAIETPDNGGARVVIWLPSGLATPATVNTPTVTAEMPAVSNTVVWLVEDQDALRMTMRRLLESMGLIVEDVDNADRAAQWLIERPPPDLLLSDVIMPGTRTGNELADEMRKRYPQLPVLLMSGYTDLVEIDYPILQKPFSLEELRNRVAQALSARRPAKAG